MRTRAAHGRLFAMTELTRVVLDLDRTAEPISGCVHVAGGPRVAFSGWLELVALLERVAGPDAFLTEDES